MAVENIASIDRIGRDLIISLGKLEERLVLEDYLVIGWVSAKIMPDEADYEDTEFVEKVKNWILNLENNIQRRFLKPPFVKSITDVLLFPMLNNLKDTTIELESDIRDRIITTLQNLDVTVGQENNAFAEWRNSVEHATNPQKLLMAVYILESSTDWNKSSRMKRCSYMRCMSAYDVDLAICAACRRWYHHCCIKTFGTTNQTGSSICVKCINKSTGCRLCLQCGLGNQTKTMLLICEKCEITYHQSCLLSANQRHVRIFSKCVRACEKFFGRTYGGFKRFFEPFSVISRVFRACLIVFRAFCSIEEDPPTGTWFCHEHRE